jgi:hypothetical protein
MAIEQFVHGGLMRGASGLVDGSTLAAQKVGIVRMILNKLTARLETNLSKIHDNAEEMLDER